MARSLWPSARAGYNSDADSDLEINVVSSIDNTRPGKYDFVYKVSDSSGNTIEKVLTVYVMSDDFDYCESINNSTMIDERALTVIKEFMNNYYVSLKYLKMRDFSDLFTTGKSLLFEGALSSLIEYRNTLQTDLKVDECLYSLKKEEVKKIDNGYSIYVLEDASMSFHYLNGVETKTRRIGIYLDMTEDNGNRLIDNFLREEGVFI